MINIKELQLGNWIGSISCPFEYEQVEGIETHNVQSNINRVDISDCVPILLTEKIVLAAGFKKIENKEGIYRKDEWQLYSFFKGGGALIYKEYNKEYCLLTLLHYVHQLQNFYFILTGDELKINLMF